jgi:hypothetical protein
MIIVCYQMAICKQNKNVWKNEGLQNNLTKFQMQRDGRLWLQLKGSSNDIVDTSL